MTLLFEPFAPLFELTRSNRTTPASAPRAFLPAADVLLTDDDVVITMDVPGLTADDVHIELVDDVLTVRGERALPYANEGDGARKVWQRIERGFGSFERTIRVPKGLDPDTINAALVNGVLTLHVPRPEARKPRRIEITAAGAQPAIEGTSHEERELAGAAAG